MRYLSCPPIFYGNNNVVLIVGFCILILDYIYYMNKIKNKGVAAEYLAMAALMHNQYEVFSNISPNGDTDLIAMKDNSTFRIQVKALYKDNKGHLIGDTHCSSNGKNRKMRANRSRSANLCKIINEKRKKTRRRS